MNGDETKLQTQHNELKAKLLESYDELTSGFESVRVMQIRGNLDTNLQTKYKTLLFDNRLIADKVLLLYFSCRYIYAYTNVEEEKERSKDEQCPPAVTLFVCLH